MLWAALSMGILASIHCVGMCGPLAMAATRGYSPNFWVNAGIPYHLGRITTYALLGAGMGSLSVSVAWAGYQQVFSILMGILMLVVIIGSWLHHSERISWKPLDRIFLRLRKKMGHLLQPHTPQLTFNLGILNGFLPCGWVYMALMGAMATGSMMESIGFMTLFGLGTFPALFLLTTLRQQDCLPNIPFLFLIY